MSSVDGPQRSLYRSWQVLLARLGPLMHAADKVIFVNPLVRRLDLRREVDSIYDEFGHVAFDLDASAFLALRKPLIAWTPSERELSPDPDAYFQRHLYLGAFVTVPMPGNDHTITEDRWDEKASLQGGVP